jgi:hypothetical protein
MNLRGDDTVSAVALVVESDASLAADVSENGGAPTLDADADASEPESGADGSKANGAKKKPRARRSKR